MIDILSQCRPYIEPHGDADSRRLLREIDAAGFQTIETAPRNHLPILAWSIETGLIVAFLDATWAWWPCPATEPLPSPPSHWMALPTPPFIAKQTYRDHVESQFVEAGHDVV